jgi:hypothetical protein
MIMKRLFLVPLLVVIGCAGPKSGKLEVRPRAVVVPANASDLRLRHDEVIGRYHIGRLVDPANSLLMHEGHPVYRIESESAWNLYPGALGTVPAPMAGNPVPVPGYAPPPADGEVIAELERQRELTQGVMAQSAQLDQALRGLSGALALVQSMAEEGRKLRTDLGQALARIEALEGAMTQTRSGPRPGAQDLNPGP